MLLEEGTCAALLSSVVDPHCNLTCSLVLEVNPGFVLVCFTLRSLEGKDTISYLKPSYPKTVSREEAEGEFHNFYLRRPGDLAEIQHNVVHVHEIL